MAQFMNGSAIAMPLVNQANYPTDAKTIANTKLEVFEKLPLSSRFLGLEIYIESEKQWYAFVDGITDDDFKPSRTGGSGASISDWTFKNSYNKGDMVIYQGSLYRVVNDIPESLKDPSIDIANFEIIGGSSGGNVGNIKFLTFTQNYNYSYSEVIRHNGILYSARKSFTSGDAFDIADWELTSGDLKSTIHDLNQDGKIDTVRHAEIADVALESALLSTWKPNTEYETSQQVVHLNRIYSVIKDHTSPSLFDEEDANLQLMATGIHDELLFIQGGNKDKKEYYHIDEAEHEIISKINANVDGTLDYNGVKIGDMAKVVYDKNNDGVVDKATTLDGMISSIEEINFSKGLKSNIQSQIDLLTGVANFTQTVPTKADLDLIVGAKEKDMVIVTADETQGGVTTVYVHNGTDFQYVSPFTATVRDFNTSPIEIATETIGIVTEDRIDDTIARIADVKILPNYDLVSTYTQTEANLEDAVAKKHVHANKTLLDGYTQTNVDLSKAVKQTHEHTNANVLNSFSESADGKLLYKGAMIEGGGGGGITDLSVFTTADLKDSVNKRYVTDAEKTNLNNLSGIVTDQALINKEISDIKDAIPDDASLNNKLITSDKVDDKIKNLKIAELSDVESPMTPNSFLITDKTGSLVTYKSDLKDLINIQKVTDKRGIDFYDVPFFKFEEFEGVQRADGELILSSGNKYTTDLIDMPKEFVDGQVLVANSDTMTYELKSLDDLTNSHENKSYDIPLEAWEIDVMEGVYVATVTHGLGSKNVVVATYEAATDTLIRNVDVVVIDDMQIKLKTSKAIECRVVVNSSQGTIGYAGGGNANVQVSDFIDDLRVRADKTYSSQKIVDYLQINYANKSSVYNKAESDAKYSTRENEHVHSNKIVLDSLRIDEYGDIYCGSKKIMTEINPFTYRDSFVNQEKEFELDVLVNVTDVFSANKYKAIMNTELTIRNNIEKSDEETDALPENQLRLVVTDGTLTVLDVNIKPYETQKYLLGISPNMKILAQGKFDANFYLTAY